MALERSAPWICILLAACGGTVRVEPSENDGGGGSPASGSVTVTSSSSGSISSSSLSSSASSGAGGAGGSSGAGGCTADCALCGGTCEGSACTSQLLATDDTSGSFAGNVLLDAQYVYWGDLNPPYAIRRVPKVGGPAETLAVGEGTGVLAKDDAFLYWVRWSKGTVMKMPLDGSSMPVELAQGKPNGLDDARGLAIDASTVYWTTFASNGVWSVPIDGGAPVQLATADAPSTLVADATRLYWIETFPQTAVVAMPLGGGPKVTLASNPSWSNACQGGLVLAGDYAYWANDTGHQVLRIPLAGGPWIVIASGQPQPCFIAVDNANAYWTNLADGSVAKAPLAGGPVVELAASPDWFPTGIAVDEHCVYWAASVNAHSGAILRVAK